ncbi:MAG: C-GCAxxG-C-C family protein [Phascolarctobacterium sp.]|uniref:C-GCAxxG-C-C family protein n=1 Tax=Phascolarctobacterium sp. TaxID=2049039 RepID=UPI0026DD3E76|nr:C-GCAxxG-C-C family protein [Phascolarctobacterium sp.]MDO4921621.1 C-GCAxxG-C-C family protein [Phascolarctobacterium sp.]
MSEFSERMGMAAGNNFKSGFNCCEAIVETFRKEAGVDIDDNAFRLCSGFGGGIGHARDLCGALAGCTMVISTLAGRNHPSEKPLGEIYPLTLEFHERFKEAFGSTACGDLMPYEFNTRDHLKNCLKLVNKMAQLLAVYLEEKALLKA